MGLIRKAHKFLWKNAGLVPVFLIIIFAFIGPYIAPTSPYDFVGVPFDPPGPGAPLGYDALGRDVLSRVLAGGRRILLEAALATMFGTFVGAVLGIAGAYFKGMLDDVIMRSCDVALAFPQIILALMFISMLGPHPVLIIAIVAATHVPQVARTVHSAALRIAGEDYVRYAEMIGTRPGRMILGEFVPNLSSILRVELGLRLTFSIALIAGLGFLGISADPSLPDWGLMINENRIGLDLNPWPVVVPILIIAILTVSLNLWSDRQQGKR